MARKIPINGSIEGRKIINEIVDYIVTEEDYSHEKYFDYDPETGDEGEVVYKIVFTEVLKSMRESLKAVLMEANYEIDEDLYGEIQKDMSGVLRKYDLLNNIKKSFIKSYVTADYSIGLEASFAIGSNATQVTLNSFHSSGALKKTEDAISSIVNISKGSSKAERSITRVMFEKESRPKTFYEVMKDRRKDFVATKFDFFVQSEEVISLYDIIDDEGPPLWYQFYEDIYDKNIAKILINSRDSLQGVNSKDFWNLGEEDLRTIKLTKYTLDVDNLYSFQVTPGEIVEKLEEVSNNKFLFLHSPILREKVNITDTIVHYDGETTEKTIIKEVARCYIHVYLLPNKDEKYRDLQKAEETILVTDGLGVFNKVLVRGIEGIRQLVPESIEISMMIDASELVYKSKGGSYWNVYFDPVKLKLFNVKPRDIVDFLVACDYTKVRTKRGVDPLEVLDELEDLQFFFTDEKDLHKMVCTIFTHGVDPKTDIYEKIEAEKTAHRQAINQNLQKRNTLYQEGKRLEAYSINVFKAPEHEKIRSKNEIIYAETVGADIMEIWKVPGVDPNHTFSTHFHEMNEMLGIEGVRNVIGMEFFTASGYGGYIDPRHVLLAVDRMTHTPWIRGFRKEIFTEENYSAIMKTLLGSPSGVMARASALGETKEITSPLESVFLGGRPNFGTMSKSTRIEFDESFEQNIKKKQRKMKIYDDKDLKKKKKIRANLVDDILQINQQVVETPSGTLETTKGGTLSEDFYHEDIVPDEKEMLLRKKISPYLSMYNQKVDRNISKMMKEKLEEQRDGRLEETITFSRFFEETPQQFIGFEKLGKSDSVYEYSEPKNFPPTEPILKLNFEEILV